MRKKNYSIRTMTRDEIGIAVEWAAREGWNPGLHDADCYAMADPDGFLIGLLGDEPIASISVVKYGDAFGFLGFYIVKPEYRGQGYGLQIWNAGLQTVEGRNVGLDGVVAQQDNYRKSGFKLAYRNIRYEAVGGGAAPADARIVHLSSLPFETVNAYDQPFFPEDRSGFLKAWITQPGCEALGIVDQGRLSAYGVIRPCRSGHKIGPLLGDSPDLAEQLFVSLKSTVRPSEPIFLDTPEINRAAVAMAERHDMEVSFETARMYTGQVPELPMNRLFGVTSFEVG